MPRKADPALPGNLLAIATQLFANQGFHATSIEEVAAAAGCTKGAFYPRFPSKIDLFRAVLGAALAGFDPFPGQAAAGDPAAALGAFLRAYLEAHRRRPELWRLRWVLDTELREVLPEAGREGIRAAQGRLRTTLRALLHAGLRAGRLRVTDPAFEAFRLSCLLEGALAQLAASPHEAGPFFDPELLVEGWVAALRLPGRRRPPAAPRAPDEPAPEDYRPPF